MTQTALQRKETLLTETLLSALDARESARLADAPMLVYLAEMLIKRTNEDLQSTRCAADTSTNTPPANGL